MTDGEDLRSPMPRLLDDAGALPRPDGAPQPDAARVPVRGPALVILLAIATALLWPVQLLTAPEDGMVGCYTSGADGVLTVDPNAGTAIVQHDTSVPVMWPYGYSGRRTFSGVEVVDDAGHVVARTGIRVQIAGGYTGDAPRVFLACGLVQAQ